MEKNNILSYIKHRHRFIRFASFDTSTEQGRSNERHRRIMLTALASATAKIISVITSFITVPLTLHYLGTERYGLWMTINSVIAMMVFADFGIGNGLMNAVSEAYGKDDANALKSHIANSMLILSLIALFILASFFISYSYIDWGIFFNVKSSLAIQESGLALAVFVACFAMGVPAGIVQRVQMGLQQGFASSLWQAGGSVLGLLLTLVVISFKGGLPWLVLAVGGSPVILLVLNGLFFFGIQRRDLVPDTLSISRSGISRILYGGFFFFVLQVGVSIAYASDNIIIARILGPSAVTQYSVISKLFEGALMVIGIALAPLWPAYGEAKVRGDRSWIKKTLGRSMLTTLVLVVSSAVTLVVFYKPLLHLWIGTEYVFQFSLVAWYALWMIIKGLGGTYAIFLNGMNVMRFQMIITIIFVTASIVFKIFLTNKIGLIGVPIALVFTYLCTVSVPYMLTTNRVLKM